MKKCIYCGKKIEYKNERCKICNLAWEDGYKTGIQFIKGEVDDALIKLKQLKNAFNALIKENK